MHSECVGVTTESNQRKWGTFSWWRVWRVGFGVGFGGPVHVLSPTSTSQQCDPELKPSEPRTHSQKLNLSGLSGSVCLRSVISKLVRSSEMMNDGCAVFGSNTTGAEQRDEERVSKWTQVYDFFYCWLIGSYCVI